MHSIAFVYVLLLNFALAAFTPGPNDQRVFDIETDDVKVPVVLGVMSRCPDALLCESVFDQVLKRVDDRVQMSLSFIGKLNASEPTYGVQCMHGPLECAGNVLELCAMKYLEQQTWWNFLHCLNFNGREKIGSPDLSFKCAKAAQFSWEESGMGECAGVDGDGTGEEGIKLLKQSVKNTTAMGIEKSCTVIINGKLACIHDGEWKQCEAGHTPGDFVKQINDAYDRLNNATSKVSLP